MSMERLKRNKQELREAWGVSENKNVHHLIFKSEGGTDNVENLVYINKDFHKAIHEVINLIDGKKHDGRKRQRRRKRRI